MDDLDWSERATWERTAEHAASGLDEPDLDATAERRDGPLSEFVRDYFERAEDHRLAITITRSNGLPLDDFELKELARRPDYPYAAQ